MFFVQEVLHIQTFKAGPCHTTPPDKVLRQWRTWRFSQVGGLWVMRLPFKGGSKLQCRKISGKLPAKKLPTLTDSSVKAMTQLTKLSTQLTLMFEDGVWPKGSNMAISLYNNWNVSHGEWSPTPISGSSNWRLRRGKIRSKILLDICNLVALMEAALKSHAPCFGLHGLHHDSTPSCFVLDPVWEGKIWVCFVTGLRCNVWRRLHKYIYIFVVFKEGACVQHQLRSILDFVWSNLSVYSPEVVVVFSRVKLFATHLDLEIILILYALYIMFAFFMRCIYIYV